MSIHITLALSVLASVVLMGLIFIIGWPLFSIFLLGLNRLMLAYGKVKSAFPYRSPVQLIEDWTNFWEDFYENNKIEKE